MLVERTLKSSNYTQTTGASRCMTKIKYFGLPPKNKKQKAWEKKAKEINERVMAKYVKSSRKTIEVQDS